MQTKDKIENSIKISWKFRKINNRETFDFKKEPNNKQTRELYKEIQRKSGLSIKELNELLASQTFCYSKVSKYLEHKKGLIPNE